MKKVSNNKPLTLAERERIGVYWAQGQSRREEIAIQLGRSHTTVSTRAQAE